MKSIFLLTLLLFSAAASAEEVKIKWKGDYPHNSSKTWTKDNPYDSGFSKNFKNGTPEEFGEVQKDGELKAFIYSPQAAKGPVPFVILLHGCDGLGTLSKEWAAHVADVLNPQGTGVLVLDSFTTRYVDRSCGPADLHWGRRRADDAYSALDYLLEKKLAKADEVYLMGYSNGGTTTLVSMTTQEADHQHHFAGAFAVAPGCSPSLQHSALYTGAIIIFMGDQDDANNPKWCEELAKKKRSVPVQMVEYRGANHGFPVNAPAHEFMGWHLSYNPTAEKDMMETINAALKMKTFGEGVELR
ncbi:prolyl oligopeptidase family serine peptidase [Bradyrhizobium rifense]|uniref:Prolyl oligopeptidase family serine peptidase n=1 Tax=Bradyrhizobium rifense TaxID=515499 RepID=A0A5D3KN48_9BRAD|nr:prolyl oligopeptidase family serine peptidase [Bradyrhizobium rifense]TYL99218.1 prolyl oligopeptidase family serine peptidase [Bradyrhizobium rifense]